MDQMSTKCIAYSRQVAQALRIEPLPQEINLHLSGYRFEWQYSVIASDQINAFCLPGGKIGVFTGLLRVVRDDDKLAAVIAHDRPCAGTPCQRANRPRAIDRQPAVDPRL